MAQINYQKLLQVYTSLYTPRNDFLVQTPDYPKGNPFYHHTNSNNINRSAKNNKGGIKTNHHRDATADIGGAAGGVVSENAAIDAAATEVIPKRLCGDWSTKLKLLRYTSTGSYLGLHFVSDYSHHFGGYKAKTYMENSEYSPKLCAAQSN